MSSIEELQQEISLLKERNRRVEVDKAWETSWSRKVLILVTTYFLVVLFFWIANLGNPFVNALVPSLGFFLSTLTFPLFKELWIGRFSKNS